MTRNAVFIFDCICHGRGWVPNGDWPRPCAVCQGAGKLSGYELSEKLDESWNVVKNLHEGRARPKTAARIFEKLTAWVM